MNPSELNTDISSYDLQEILAFINLDETSSYEQRIQAINSLIIEGASLNS